jgi:hypothetical protein
MDNINVKRTQMKIELTQQQIDKLYFSLVEYVKTQTDVDRLHDLSIPQQEMFKIELNLIKKFSEI